MVLKITGRAERSRRPECQLKPRQCQRRSVPEARRRGFCRPVRSAQRVAAEAEAGGGALLGWGMQVGELASLGQAGRSPGHPLALWEPGTIQGCFLGCVKGSVVLEKPAGWEPRASNQSWGFSSAGMGRGPFPCWEGPDGEVSKEWLSCTCSRWDFT